jgi:hypothetical protein
MILRRGTAGEPFSVGPDLWKAQNTCFFIGKGSFMRCRKGRPREEGTCDIVDRGLSLVMRSLHV